MSAENLHSLLRRQLKRCFGSDFVPPPEWREFIAAVDAAYRESDTDRGMLERSLELSSQELLHAGAEMRAVLQALPDLVIRVDDHCRVLDCKIGASGATGTAADADELRLEVASEHLSLEFRAAVREAFATGRLVSAEYALGPADNARHYEARLVCVLERQVAAFVRDITARKCAEEELYKSRAMMRTILDTIPQRVFWKDRNSVYLGANRQLAVDVGFADPAEIVGRTDVATSSAEMAEKYRADDRDVMASDLPRYNYEEPQRRPDGTIRWLQTSKVPLHDKEGDVVGVLGTYEDITDRKQIESLRAGQTRLLEMIVAGMPLAETLEALAHLMELLVSGMRCTIMLVEGDGKRLRVGVAPSRPAEYVAEANLLIDRAGSAGCSAAAQQRQIVISSDTATDPAWRDLRAFAEKYEIRASWSAPAISSRDTVLATVAMHFAQPRSPGPGEIDLLHIASHVAGIAIERQRAEHELRRTLSLVQSTLESTADGILVVNREGRIVSFNARFRTLWGILPDLLAAADEARCLEHMRAQVKNPEPFLKRVDELNAQPQAESFDVLEFKDGRVVERYSSPQLLDGQAIGRVWNFRDITKRVRLEEQFRQAQKMDAIGQLAGGVAHDFNNLLTVIIGNLSLVNGGGLMPAQLRAALEDSLRSARRAANLTGQLLTFSRRQAIETKDIDLNQLVTDLGKMLRRLIGEHIALDTRLVPGGAHVRADPGMMEQTLMNLALNSRDAMTSGGRLLITTQVVQIAPEALALRPKARPGAFVRLSVADNGAGIPPEHLPRIFEPFFTTKEVGRGTGLGLAMVFGIIEQHEGWIEVESRVGVGTTIDVFLPRLAAGIAPRPEPVRAVQPRRGHEAVLVAEDESEVRTLMQKLLEGHGYRVHAVRNGPEALGVWRAHRSEIALLVTDMVMPGGMGGRELAERLLAEKPELRVIYCSGYSDEMIGGAALFRGKPNFLEKPFDVHMFLERVRTTLDQPV